MKDNELYYYRYKFRVGSCNIENKNKIISFIESNPKYKSVKWISKTEYNIIYSVYLIIVLVIYPIYLIFWFLSKISNKFIKWYAKFLD